MSWIQKVKENWNPIARALVLVFGLLWLMGGFWFTYSTARPLLPAEWVFVLVVVVDCVLAFVGGLRGRRLALSILASGLITAFVFLWNDAAGWLVGSGSLAWASYTLMMIVFTLTVALVVSRLDLVHATMLGAFAGFVLAQPIVSMFSFYTWDPTTPYASFLDWRFIAAHLLIRALCCASIAFLALYLRRGRVSKRWVRSGLARLAPALGVLVCALLFAIGIIWLMSSNAVSEFQFESKVTKLKAATSIAQDLTARFQPSEIASATPAVRERVRVLSAATRYNWDLTIADVSTGRIILAMRPVSAGNGDDEWGFVTLDASQTAQIRRELKRDQSGGWSPGLPIDGWRFAWRRIGKDESSPLVVFLQDWGSRGMMDFSIWEVPETALGTHLPWMFSAMLLPMSIVLLVLERRDAARSALLASQERARLARDAHDRVYNRMTALAGQIASGGAGADPSAQAEEIRGAVRDLQRILGDVDARAAIEPDTGAGLFDDVVADQADRWGIAIELRGADALAGLDPRVAWELQCVVDEALTNVGKHAGARTATVTASREGSRLRIEVADDGTGIAGPLGADGLPEGARGLRGVVDRMRSVGGTMTLATGATGTTLAVELPV